MALPENARAVPYGDVWEAYRNLERFIEATDLVLGASGLVMTSGPDGTEVSFEDPAEWVVPFQVGASSSRATVTLGEMAGEIPTIHDETSGKYRTIDGLDESGRYSGIPFLPLSPPETSRVSFVCIRCEIDRSTGDLLVDEEGKLDPIALRIVHRHEKPKRTADGGSEAQVDSGVVAVGYDVIARIYWTESGERVRTVRQVATWNRNFAFKRGDGESVPDRFFPFHA